MFSSFISISGRFETVVRHPKLLRRRRCGRRKMWCCVCPVQRKPTAITPNKAKLAAYIAVFKPNAWSYEREAKLNKTCFMKAEEDTACLVFRMFERTEEQFGKSEDFWQRCRAGGRRAAGRGGKKRRKYMFAAPRTGEEDGAWPGAAFPNM